jgi:quinol monooxygenase YgiN
MTRATSLSRTVNDTEEPMSQDRVEMTALITAAPGKEAQIRERLREVVAETVKEPGCVEFRIFEQLDAPGRFVLWEVFASPEALKVHVQKDYTQAYFASGLVASTQVIKQKLL